ncbi:hypothetical protein BofuT4_uP092690.1 [Botrytis cinerea T4]|uniref:Uncharacterized protein n=1 Tax=Botryotinia fuckeliana (strain T4) TaxID=999810 RepID=G2YDZ9_BOTF4|nr:hypothetical protein BofuT4_uP092690.1 [Botrytis cinerea T4]
MDGWMDGWTVVWIGWVVHVGRMDVETSNSGPARVRLAVRLAYQTHHVSSITMTVAMTNNLLAKENDDSLWADTAHFRAELAF